MKFKEIWNRLTARQKLLVIIRDFGILAVVLSGAAQTLGWMDNALPVLVCLPAAALAQAAISWKQARQTAIFFLLAALFVMIVYGLSAAA